MKKRIITMILTLTMLLSLCIPAMAADTETNAGFTDVSSGAWYADAVEYVTTHKLFAGTSDTTFAPNAPMTRGMFVTVLARMAGVKEASIINNHAFVDNNFGSWYGPSVEWGYENGFINGVSADSFLPNQNLTREQMAVIIYRFLNRLGVEMQDSPTATKSFADAAKVSGYAKVAVDEMRRIGFLNGSNGYVDPLRNITRAEAATFFMRVDSFLDSYTGSVGLALSNTAVTMPSGYVAQLYAYTVPEGVADNIIWASADSRIATVDANGIVTGRAEGTVTVTALTQTGYAAACSVTITKGNDTPAPEIPTDSEITNASQGNIRPENAVIPVENIVLSQNTAALKTGDTIQLNATVEPFEATDKTVTWSSQSPAVAAVDGTGMVTAKGVGTAVITAKAGSLTADCTVTVTEDAPAVIPVSDIKLDKREVETHVGDSFRLSATVSPENANDKSVKWSSSNTNVTVAPDGTVTAVRTGSSIITAKAGNKTATCNVTILPAIVPVTDVKLSATSLEMTEGDTKALTASVLPNNATDKAVHWGTNNGQVAVVEQDGTIVAKSAGTAIITATAGNVSASCTVNVKAKYIDVDSVILSQDTAELKVNGSIMLTATVSPANATEPAVTWSAASGNIEIKDNKDGTCTVTAKAAGEAVVTATAGKKSASCTVTITEEAPKVIEVETVTLNLTNTTMQVGDTLALTATVLPEAASDKSVTWTTDKSGIVEVSNGNVVAKAAGEVRVTATAGQKSAVCTIKVLEKDTGNATFTVETAEYNLSTSPFFDGFIDTIKPTCNHAQSNSSDSFNDIIYGPGNWYRNVEDHFTFESSDTSVVTVTEKGHMYHAPLPNDSAPRTAYVTVTHKADGTTLKVKVTVSIGKAYYEVNDDYIAAYAAEMLKLVNEARREAGLTAAVYSSDPVSQATVNARAEELKTKYSHNRPNGGTRTDLQIEMGCTERWGGENIAMVGFNYMEVDGCLYTPNKPETEARYFFNLWMSDIGHRKEILLPVDNNRMVCGLHVGKGNIYAVQWFGVVD